MPKIFARSLTVVFVLAAIVVAILWWTAPRPAMVHVTPVVRGRVEQVVANTRAGTVRAARRSGLSPAVPGEVVKLPVDEGDVVEKGQVLLELWSDNVRAQLELARAEIQQAEATHSEACQRAGLAEREAERARELQRTGIRSPEQLDQKESEAAALAAGCTAAEAGVAVARAKVRTLETNLEQLVVRAPFDGVVADVNAELGEYATPSPVGIPTPPAIDLFDRSSLYVEAPLDEVDAPTIRLRMPVRVTLDAFRGEEYTGKVSRIAPYVLEVEKQARTVAIDVVFDDPAVRDRLLPGYSADVEVVLGVAENVLRVPTEVLYDDAKVLVFDPAAGVLREVTVETGLANWQFTEVRSGLPEGALVVTDLDRSALGDGVRAVPVEAGVAK